MIVTKVFHSCFMVEYQGHRGIIDPSLVLPIDGAYMPRDGWRIDLDELIPGDWDFVFVSHAHRDHFDPYTLVRFPRQIPIVFGTPAEEGLKQSVRALGFTQLIPLAPWEERAFGPFTLMPVPTSSKAAETGVTVQAGDAQFLHLIDVATDASIAAEYLRRWGPPTLFSPRGALFNEHTIPAPTTCTPFPEEKLREWACSDRAFQARHVVLSGHDFACGRVPWVNRRLFPTSKEEHLASYRHEDVAPAIELAAPGQWWELDHGGVIARGAGAPWLHQDGPVFSTNWDPAYPVRPFRDNGEFDTPHDPRQLALQFEALLLTAALKWVPDDVMAGLREKARRWRYRLHTADGICFDATLVLTGPVPFWAEPDDHETLFTDIAASAWARVRAHDIGWHTMRVTDQFRSNAPVSWSMWDIAQRVPHPQNYLDRSVERALAGLAPYAASLPPLSI